MRLKTIEDLVKRIKLIIGSEWIEPEEEAEIREVLMEYLKDVHE